MTDVTTDPATRHRLTVQYTLPCDTTVRLETANPNYLLYDMGTVQKFETAETGSCEACQISDSFTGVGMGSIVRNLYVPGTLSQGHGRWAISTVSSTRLGVP